MIQLYTVYKTYFRFKDINRLKVKGAKGIPCKQKPKENCSGYINIRKNRL